MEGLQRKRWAAFNRTEERKRYPEVSGEKRPNGAFVKAGPDVSFGILRFEFVTGKSLATRLSYRSPCRTGCQGVVQLTLTDKVAGCG